MLAFIGVASLTIPGAMAHSRGGVAPEDERTRISNWGRTVTWKFTNPFGYPWTDAQKERVRAAFAEWETRDDVDGGRPGWTSSRRGRSEMRGRVVAFVIAGAVAVGGVGSRSASSGTSAGRPPSAPRPTCHGPTALPTPSVPRHRRHRGRSSPPSRTSWWTRPRRRSRISSSPWTARSPGPAARTRSRRGSRPRPSGCGRWTGTRQRRAGSRRATNSGSARRPSSSRRGGRDPPRPRRAARGRAVERAVRGGALRSGCDRDRSLTLRGAADRDPRGLPHLRGQPRIGCQRAGSHPRLERGGGPGRRAHRGGVGAVRG